MVRVNVRVAQQPHRMGAATVPEMTGTWYKVLSPTTIYITDDNPVKRGAANAMPVTAPPMSIVEAARCGRGGRGGR